MTAHVVTLTVDGDGWDIAECSCDWTSPPCPDGETAAGFWGDHLLADAGIVTTR